MMVHICRPGTSTNQPRFTPQDKRASIAFCGALIGNKPCCRRRSLRHWPPASWRDMLANSGGDHAG
jgi:hypothetical protein